MFNADTVLEHGGKLRQAAARYSIPLNDWLDLSTGINPNGWPVPVVPASIWARLPENEDELEAVARQYFNTSHLLPVAGSQAAIQTLPLLRATSRVAVLDPTYAEHAHAWQRAGHRITTVSAPEISNAIVTSDVVILVNPNNPTGVRFPREQLLLWHAQLAANNGWLIVDEAFVDSTPEDSLTPYCPRPGLIVLRSLGKFFGLAGARVGFVCAPPPILTQLTCQLGPWPISTPARWVASNALKDSQWHDKTRHRLKQASTRLREMLTQNKLVPDGGCSLFQWLKTPHAPRIHQRLAEQGIFTRLFNKPASLRLGLPGCESDWQRLNRALNNIVNSINSEDCS